MLAQRVLFRVGGRVFFRARQRGRLHQAGGRIPAEPVVANAPDDAAAIGAETRVGLGVGAAGQLHQRPAQHAQENVAIADEDRLPAARVEHRARGVEFRQGGAFDLRRFAAGHGHRPGVAHRAAFALERVQRALAVE